MRKLLLSLLLALPFITSAQVFEKGDMIIGANAGISIYHYQYTDLTTNITGERDTSGSSSFPFSFEYGITNWLGGALTFNYNNFLEGDSADNENARSLDFVLGANFHVPWNLKKFDLVGQVGYGFSNFKYTVNNTGGGEAKANGGVLYLGLNPRFYFSSNRHLGIGPWYRYSSYKYKNGTISDSFGNTNKFNLSGPANSFGLGLFYRI